MQLIGEPDAACNAVVGAAVALSGQLYLQSHPPNISCCPQCSGEIKLVWHINSKLTVMVVLKRFIRFFFWSRINFLLLAKMYNFFSLIKVKLIILWKVWPTLFFRYCTWKVFGNKEHKVDRVEQMENTIYMILRKIRTLLLCNMASRPFAMLIFQEFPAHLEVRNK